MGNDDLVFRFGIPYMRGVYLYIYILLTSTALNSRIVECGHGNPSCSCTQLPHIHPMIGKLIQTVGYLYWWEDQ